MVLILLLLFFAVWAFFFLPYAKKIPIWLKWKNPKRGRWILIILFLILPFGDEIIGRVQFAYVCSKGNLLHVAPDIKSYEELVSLKGAEEVYLSMTAIPISKITGFYISPSSRKIVISSTRFFTYGGFFHRNLLFPNRFTSCPKISSGDILYKNGFIYKSDGIYIRRNKEDFK